MSKIIIPSKSGRNGLGAGVWNLGPGRDPFGGPTRTEIPILERIPRLAAAGITCQEAHEVEIPLRDAPAAKKLLQKYIADILLTSIANLQRLWAKALRVDRKKIVEFRSSQRYTALAGYLAECLY